jgi:trehalose 6-phosphate synthase
MKHYDVLVVNSIADGMNLVAKEGPIVNRNDGVLVISEGAGAVEELGDSSLVVNAFDLMGTAAAFHEALTMDRETRAEALVATREAIYANTIFRGAHDQLLDLLPAPHAPGAVTMLPPTTVGGELESEVSP